MTAHTGVLESFREMVLLRDDERALDLETIPVVHLRSGGKQVTRMPRWQVQELELLAELYPACSNLEIAKQLGRSVKSIVSKAHHMGLKKDLDRLREMGRQNVSLRYDAKPR